MVFLDRKKFQKQGKQRKQWKQWKQPLVDINQKARLAKPIVVLGLTLVAPVTL
jgi:hypothetical protein